jgi:anaerobic selenocysteine-containing dehydrogenase
VEVNAEDARELRVREGQVVRIESRRGVVELPARVSREIRRGVVFAPMHWGEAWSAMTAVNLLTHGAYDPVSKEPELKHCAVRVSKVVGSAGGVGV